MHDTAAIFKRCKLPGDDEPWVPFMNVVHQPTFANVVICLAPFFIVIVPLRPYEESVLNV